MKKIVSMIMMVALLFCTNVNAFAATNSTLHKVNGTYSSGGSTNYTTTTTVTCNEIRAMGTTYDGGGTKYVDITVKKGLSVYAYAMSVPLDGQEHTLVSGVNLPAGTYTVYIKSYDSKAYDVSTYFYY